MSCNRAEVHLLCRSFLDMLVLWGMVILGQSSTAVLTQISQMYLMDYHKILSGKVPSPEDESQ